MPVGWSLPQLEEGFSLAAGVRPVRCVFTCLILLLLAEHKQHNVPNTTQHMVILGTDAEHNTTQRVRSGQSCTMASCSGQGISNADKVLSVPAAGIRGTAEKEGDILNAQRSVLDNLCKVTLAQLDIVHGGLWHSCDCINFPGVLSFVPGNLCLKEGYEYCGQKREFMAWAGIVTIR